MTGFPVKNLSNWIKLTYGPCTVTTSHLQEVAPNDNGDMVAIAGSCKVFLTMNIEFQHRPGLDASVTHEIGQMLCELGAKCPAPFSMSAHELDGTMHATLTYLIGDVALV